MLTKTQADAQPDRQPGAHRGRSWLGLLLPAVIAFVILIGLGVWQIERKAWKEGLIADLTQRLAAPPHALPPTRDWPELSAAKDEYRRVTFTAQFDNAREALVFASASAFRPDVADAGPGYWVFTPARLADGSVVVVNRGFVPEARKNPQSRAEGEVSGPVTVVGAMRWPDSRHWFTPADDPARNLWFTRDPAAIAGAKGLSSVAPFYVEQEAPAPPGGLPQPGRLMVSLPDNHLQYALTWFGLAAVLAGSFIAWAAGSGRASGR